MKPNTLRRAIALLLSLALFLTALPMTALAAELDPDELTEQTAELPEETAQLPEEGAGLPEEDDPVPDEAAPEDAAVTDSDSEEAVFTADVPEEAASQEAMVTGDGPEVEGSAIPSRETTEAALSFIRELMRSRETEFSVDVPDAVSDELDNGGMELLLAETDNPEEGDYLRASTSAYRVSKTSVNGRTVRTYHLTYNDNKELAAQASAKAAQVVQDLGLNNPNLSRLEKVRKAYVYLTENVSYASNSPALTQNPRPADPIFSGPGALINGRAVCQGFPAAFYLLLRLAGVPVRMIFSRQMDHAWAAVQLENGLWYQCDPTWDAGKAPGKQNYRCRGKYDFTGHSNSDDNFHDPAFREAHPLDDRDPDYLESGYGEAPRFTMVTKDDCVTTTLSENGRAKLLVFLNPDPAEPNGKALVESLQGTQLPGVDVLLMGFAQTHEDQTAFLDQVGECFPEDDMPYGSAYSACANVIPALNALCAVAGIDTADEGGGNAYTLPCVFLVNAENRVIFAGCGLPGYMEEFLAPCAAAAEAEPSLHQIEGADAVGLCGDNVYWHIYDGRLVLSCIDPAADNPTWDNTSLPTSIGWLSERLESGFASSFSHVEIPAASIREVTVEEGVTSVGENLFIDCSALECITFPGHAPAMDGSYIANGATVYFPDGDDSWNGVINSAAFPNCTWKVLIANVEVTAGDLTYNGQAQSVKVTFTVNGKVLPESDYTVTPATVTNMGAHDFTVRGKGIYADCFAAGKVNVNPPTFGTTEAALSFIREQMRSRATEFVLQVPNAVSDELSAGSWGLLLEETDNPAEGDYLRAALSTSSVETSKGPENTCHTYHITYNDLQGNVNLESQATAAVGQLTRELGLTSPTLSRREKLSRIYGYLTANVQYAVNSPALKQDVGGDDTSTLVQDTLSDPIFTAAGALVNHWAVCQGYTAAFYRLARVAGIPVRVVLSDEINHAWCTVQLEDGLWYLMDPTWDTGKSASQWNYFLRGKYDFTKHGNSDDNYHDPAFQQACPLSLRDQDYPENGYGEAPCFTMVTKDDCITTTRSENGRAKLLVFLNPNPAEPNGKALLESLQGVDLPGVDVVLMGFGQTHANQTAFLAKVGTDFPVNNMPQSCAYSACSNVVHALEALCGIAGINTVNQNGGHTYSLPSVFLVDGQNRIIFTGSGLPGYVEEFLAPYADASVSEPSLHRIEGADAVGLCGDNVYWHIYDGRMILSGIGPMWDNDEKPTSIGWVGRRTENAIASSFSHVEIPVTSIREVTVEEGITRVGSDMFAGCTALTSITFLGHAPGMGEDIAENAVVYFPDGDDSWSGVIGSDAFYNCTWKVSIDSENVTASGLTYSGKAQNVKVRFVVNGKVLPQSSYTVSPATVTNAGTHDFTVRGKGIYADSFAAGKVVVDRANLQDGALTVTPLTYNGKAQSVKVKVTLNGNVLPAANYTVSPATVTNAGTYTVTVTGRGNCTGTLTGRLTVSKASQSFTLTGKGSMLLGAKQTLKVTGAKGTVTFKSGNAKIATVTTAGLVTGKAAGTTVITVTAAGNQNYKAATKKLTLSVQCAKPAITLTRLKTGIKVSWQKKTGAAKYRLELKKSGKWTAIATITGTTFTYANAKLIDGANAFRLACLDSSGKVASAYSDVKTMQYLKPMTLAAPKLAGSRKITVTWAKPLNPTGLKVQLSTSSKFAAAKTITLGKTTTSLTVAGLVKGQTYYFRIQYSRLDNGKTVWSDWSAAKYLKVTK